MVAWAQLLQHLDDPGVVRLHVVDDDIVEFDGAFTSLSWSRRPF
jgi:hypothetical protein